MTLASQIAENLLDKGAVKVSLDPPFTWTSGIKSPIYCDNRKLISHTDSRRIILDGIESRLKELNWNFDVIGGTATAGIPWAAFLAERLNKPMIYIRPEPKGHGAGKQVEGDSDALKDKKVLILEDLFSTGGSSIKSADAVVAELSAEIVGIFAIFSYNFLSCKKNFDESGYKYEFLSDFPTLLDVARNRGMFDQDQVDVLLPFAENPQEWFVNLNN